MSDSIKSAMDSSLSGNLTPASGGGVQGGGQLSSEGTPGIIKTFTFIEVQGKAANVDGAFKDQMKPESPGTRPAPGSPRSGAEVKSAFDAPFKVNY